MEKKKKGKSTAQQQFGEVLRNSNWEKRATGIQIPIFQWGLRIYSLTDIAQRRTPFANDSLVPVSASLCSRVRISMFRKVWNEVK